MTGREEELKLVSLFKDNGTREAALLDLQKRWSRDDTKYNDSVLMGHFCAGLAMGACLGAALLGLCNSIFHFL